MCDTSETLYLHVSKCCVVKIYDTIIYSFYDKPDVIIIITWEVYTLHVTLLTASPFVRKQAETVYNTSKKLLTLYYVN